MIVSRPSLGTRNVSMRDPTRLILQRPGEQLVTDSKLWTIRMAES
jgi:hypothetical protein